MSDLALYLVMAAVGYFFGSRLRDYNVLIQWTGRMQTVAIVLLIFTMGMRMGANPEVIANLNSIGIYALIMTVSAIFFSVISMTFARKALGIDRYGNMHRKGSERNCAGYGAKKQKGEKSLEAAGGVCENGDGEDNSSGRMNLMTLIILLCVVCGLVFGHFGVPHFFTDMEAFGALAGSLINIGLCVLLFFVGFDMGVDGTVIRNFRQVGLRVLIFPVVIMAGSLIGTGVCAAFLTISLREALAVGGGFGWYSLAPGIIMEVGLVTASAVSFMHNVMREFISVLIIPFVARKAGYLEAVAVPACSSMDVCLPLIERSTRSDIAVYSFISGVIESAAVPVVVPLILG